MDESRLELKVGALVLAAVLGTFALLVLMGELSFGSGETVLVDFSHTGNVVKNAPVKLGGVAVGKVDNVELLPARQDTDGSSLPIKMTLSVSKEAAAALRADARVTVSSVGPLGESYLELWPGSAGTPHDPKLAIRGTDSPRFDVVANRLARFLDAASKVLEEDPDSLKKLINGVGGLTTTVDGMLVENKGDISGLVKDLSAASRDLRELAAVANREFQHGGRGDQLLDNTQVISKQLRGDLPELTQNASIAIGGLAKLSGEFDTADGKKVKSLIARMESASGKLDSVADRADKLLARIDKGDGSLGAALNDKQVYDDLRALLTDLRQNPWKLLWKD